jgi:hypothetical protein
VDTVRPCQRLLRLLHYCQQNDSDFSELYFRTLEQCIKSDDEKMIIIVLQQIASHLFEGTNTNDEYQRLIKVIPSGTSSFSILPSYQPILTTIQTFLSTNKTELNITNFLANHIDILYPYTASFLDVRREFRDTTQYFIDGDSLLLSIAHHTNIDLKSYYGNTLHVIFVIERILLTLFHQSHQCNYTLVFFDCHYRLYQQENAILSLLRTCLITHLSKNTNQYGTRKIQQFSSWLNEDYLKFIREEKPMFLFYHDMSSFDSEKNHFLSKEVLEKLLCVYRLYGNYHQYVIQCQLYLMNKLTLTETTVKCFQIQFNRMCSKKLLGEFIQTDLQHSKEIKEQDWSKYEKLGQEFGENDVRLSLYLKTIVNFIEENNQQYPIQLFSPLFILHVALLIRLSLGDRHLPLSFPSVTYSPIFSQFIVQFQQYLALNLASCSSSLSWSKIADLFDGRLFTFTLYQIYQSSDIRLDSRTSEIVNESLKLLNIPSSETLFQDIVKQLIQSNDIIFSSSSSEQQVVPIKKQRNTQQIVKISNPFISAYLEPILSSKGPLKFELVDPDGSELVQHKGTFSSALLLSVIRFFFISSR